MTDDENGRYITNLWVESGGGVGEESNALENHSLHTVLHLVDAALEFDAIECSVDGPVQALLSDLHAGFAKEVGDRLLARQSTLCDSLELAVQNRSFSTAQFLTDSASESLWRFADVHQTLSFPFLFHLPIEQVSIFCFGGCLKRFLVGFVEGFQVGGG